MKPRPGDHHPDGEIGVTKEVGVYSLDSVNFLEPINNSDKYKSEIEFSGKSSETNFENPEGKFDEFTLRWSVNDGSSSNIIPSGSKVVDINVSSQMAQTGIDSINIDATEALNHQTYKIVLKLLHLWLVKRVILGSTLITLLAHLEMSMW